MATFYPADPQSKLRSTYGRTALAQIFDYFPYANGSTTSMSTSAISSDAYRYDWVWGSGNDDGIARPQAWRGANTAALVTRYYITEEDNIHVSGHNLQYWQSNHPDWILYACKSDGTPTHDIAYTPGDTFPDVPLNMHNPQVVQYQIQDLLAYAQANGYNAIALDQVVFKNIMAGGNPELGQTVQPGEYGCGVWNNDGSFTTVYANPKVDNSQWIADLLNWVQQAKQAANAVGIAVAVNHPPGNINDPNEQALLRSVDITLDESGFSDYGNYQNAPGVFMSTYNYMEYVQRLGDAIGLIDRWPNDGTTVQSQHVEYSIATYLMANEGNADLYVDGNNTVGYGYGSEEYFSQYSAQLGAPCDAMYGGSSYDPNNPYLYYRRFESGMVLVNAGNSSQTATLPSDHTYTDINYRPVSNPQTVAPFDAYVLTTTGNGCQ